MAEDAPPTKQVAMMGGYENHFVEPVPDRLLCLICQYPSREPHLSVCCGNVFCKSCLDAAKQVRSVEQVCPNCRNKEFPSVPNKQADREIRSFCVFCDNKQKGCEWKGELNNLNNHLKASCLFELVQCPNNCGNLSERKYMASHVEIDCPRRMVKCQYCGTTGEYRSMGPEHMEKCPKILLPCPNKCTIRGVPREDMETHRKECSHEIVQCEYHNVGCEQRMMRKDLVIHHQNWMGNHLAMTVRCVSIQQRHIENLTATIAMNGKELSASKNELLIAKNTISATEQKLFTTVKELEDTRSLTIDLNKKLVNQETHLNLLQDKLAKDVKELTDSGNVLQKTLNSNIEIGLLATKQKHEQDMKHITAALKETEGRLQSRTQTEVKELKAHIDWQCEKVRTDIDKELSTNKQKLAMLTKQCTATKDELDKLSKTTKDSIVASTNTLDTKLQAEIAGVKMKLTNEQQQTRNGLTATMHDIGHLKENLRKMNQEFNVEALLQREIEKLKGHIERTYTPQARVLDLEQQLDITPGQIKSLRWTRELHSTSITGEEMCPVIIKVPKFTDKKEKEVKWCSHGFYTHNRGYKMCLRVIAGGAGAGKGTHLSVFLYLMKGQYDGQLEWPLKGEFEMMLLNQMMDDEHRSNTVKFSEKTPAAIANKVKSGEMAADGLGRNEFILEKDLTIVTQTCQYLKDDSIFIKVSRKP